MGGKRSRILPPFTTTESGIKSALDQFIITMRDQRYSKAKDYILNINFISNDGSEYVNSILYINVLKAGSRRARFEYFCPRHQLYARWERMRYVVCKIIDHLSQQWARDLADNACDRLCQVYKFGQFFEPSNLYIAHFLQLRQSLEYAELNQEYANVRTTEQGIRLVVSAVRVIQKLGQLIAKCITNDITLPSDYRREQLQLFGPDANGTAVSEVSFKAIEPILKRCRLQPGDFKVVDELIKNDRWDVDDDTMRRWERFIELPDAVAPIFKGRTDDIRDEDLVEASDNLFV
jgi:hypothetical protein